jgi:hypothetical protein
MAFPQASQTTSDFITASIWNGLVANLNLLKTPLDNGGNLAPPAATSLTLSANVAGVIVPVQNAHTVDTFAAAAAGDLATLTIAGNIRAGHLQILSAANVAHVVTVRGGAGNVTLAAGDYALDAASKMLLLLLVGTTWIEVARSSHAATTRTTGSTGSITDADTVVLVTATSTQTLPTPVGRAGRGFTIKNTATSTTVTLATAAGLIDGVSTQTIAAQYDSLTVVSDGSNWSII